METILETRSLRKNFGSLTAVDSLSFSVHRGEVFGFLGPNGAGKTTSIKMMCGLLAPDDGKVILHCAGGSRALGVCPQNNVVWENLTCLEQLLYMGRMYGISPPEAGRKAEELLHSFGLQDKRNKLAKTLSGGMQRRLNIALALIHSPVIVFLDEPQAGLDPQSRVLVRDYIRGLRERTTVILTTHDMEEAEKLSDRICIIDHGRILALGTTEEIKRSGGRDEVIEIEIEGDIEAELLSFLSIDRESYRLSSPQAASLKTGDHVPSLLRDILEVIARRNLRVSDLHLRKRSLEDVFIGMTGRSLRE
ncbi:MAG: ATP-binding cassette domain-containing protein [Spirochaetales bacterium]|nr:ATP-binding cassette domain-containing protein [Spirochaetales bacterium]